MAGPGDVILKFDVMGRDPGTQEERKLASKALFLPRGDRVSEVQAKLRAKVELLTVDLGPDSNYCLLLPGQEGRTGLWLHPDNTLQDYMEGGSIIQDSDKEVLKAKDTLEYRKAKRMLRVRTMDLAVRTLMVDNSMTVEELVGVICKRINIPVNNDFSLAFERPKEEKSDLDDDEKRIRDKMTTLREKAKLHTEDEVNWCQHQQTLHDQGAMEEEIFLMKRKFFNNEDDMTKDNPVQLKMFYEQAKEAILNGTHPVALDTAKRLACLQLQVQTGDYAENKQIDVKGCLPEDMKKNASNLKKELIVQWQALKGHSDVDALFEYVKLTRSLNTFGVHFFLVREPQKGRSKMVPLLMGISRDSILRLDFETKMPKETFQLSQVVKYASTDKIMKVDFEKGSFTVQTGEGKKICSLLHGYMESLRERLKKQEDEDMRRRQESTKLKAEKEERKNLGSNPVLDSLKNGIQADVDRAKTILSSTAPLGLPDNKKWREEHLEKTIQSLTEGMSSINLTMGKTIWLLGQGEGTDLEELDRVATGLAQQLASLAQLACMHSALHDGEDGDAVKNGVVDLCTDLDDMFKSISDIFKKGQLGVEPKVGFIGAATKVGDTSNRVLENLLPENSNNQEKQRVNELAGAVAAATATLGQTAKQLTEICQNKDDMPKVVKAALNVVHSTSRLATTARILAPTIHLPACKDLLQLSMNDIHKAVEKFSTVATEVSGDTKVVARASEKVEDALEELEEYLTGDTEPTDRITLAGNNVVSECNHVIDSHNAPEAIKAVRKCGAAVKALIQQIKIHASETDDPHLQNYLLGSTKLLANVTRTVIEDAKNYGHSPNSTESRAVLIDSIKKLREITTCLTSEIRERKIMQKVMESSDCAMLAGQQIVKLAKDSEKYNSNDISRIQINKDAKSLEKKYDHLATCLMASSEDPDSSKATADLLEAIQSFTTKSNKMLVTSNSALKSVTDNTFSQELDDANRRSKHTLRRLIRSHKDIKSVIEKQTIEAKTMVDKIGLNLEDLDKSIDTLVPTSSADAKPTLQKIRNQLTKDLDKLQDAFGSNMLSSAVQTTGRAVAEDTFSGFKNVVEEVLKAKDGSIEAQTIIKDSQQLMNWAFEILEEGSKTLCKEKQIELKSSTEKVLDQMKTIGQKVKHINKNKRTLEEAKAQVGKALEDLGQTEAAFKEGTLENPSGVSQEEALEQLSNSRHMIKDILTKVKEAYGEKNLEEAKDQMQLLAVAIEDFNAAIKAFASTEKDALKVSMLIGGAQNLLEHSIDLIAKTKSICENEAAATLQNEAVMICETMEENIENIVNPLEAAAEDNKIINIFNAQAEKVLEQADILGQEVTSQNYERLEEEVDKLSKCLSILAERETHPDLQKEIKNIIKKLNDTNGLVSQAMCNPLDKVVLDSALNTLKTMTATTLQAVNQSLMMNKVAKEGLNTVNAVNESIYKNTRTNTDSQNQILLKKQVEKVAQSIKDLERNPTGKIQRSDMMRQTNRLMTKKENLPKKIKDAMTGLNVQLEKAKQFTKTLDIDAADEILESLQILTEDMMKLCKDDKLQASEGLEYMDNEELLKNIRSSLSPIVDYVMTEAHKRNIENVSSGTHSVADKIVLFVNTVKDAAAASKNKKDQETITWSANEAVKKAREFTQTSKDFVINPDDPGKFKRLNETSMAMVSALNLTILALPGNKIEASNDLLKDLAEDLSNFEISVQEFDANNSKTGRKRMDVINDMKESKQILKTNIIKLTENASNKDARATEASLLKLVSSLDGYKNAVKGVLANASPLTAPAVLSTAKTVLQQSSKLAIEAQVLLNNSEKMPTELNSTSEVILKLLGDVDNESSKDNDTDSITVALEALQKMLQASLTSRRELLEKKDNVIIQKVEENLINITRSLKGVCPMTEQELIHLLNTPEIYIQELKEIAKTMKDNKIQGQIHKEAVELEKLVCNLSIQAKTVNIVGSTNQIVDLWDDVAEAKLAVTEGKEIHVSKHLTKEDFIKAYTIVHSTVDQMWTSAIEGNAEKSIQQTLALRLADNLKQIVETGKAVAKDQKREKEQMQMLDNISEILEHSESFLHKAYKHVLDPMSGPKGVFDAAQGLTKALDSAVLFLPNSLEQTAPTLIKCLEQELVNFKIAVDSFSGGAKKSNLKSSIAFKSLQKETDTLGNSVSVLVQSNQSKNKTRTTEAQIQLVGDLELYKDAAKLAAMSIPDRIYQDQLISQLGTVLNKSAELVAGLGSSGTKEILQTETELRAAMTSIQNTFITATSGIQAACKFVDSLKKDNELKIEAGIPKQLNAKSRDLQSQELARNKMIQASADINYLVNQITIYSDEGNMELIISESYPLVEKVMDFEAASTKAAGTFSLLSEQKNALMKSNNALKRLEDILKGVEKVTTNPSNMDMKKELEKSQQGLAHALNDCLLSIPGKETDTAKIILQGLEAELAQFQAASQAFDGKDLKPCLLKRKPVDLEEAGRNVTSSMHQLIQDSIEGNKKTYNNSTVEMISAMDQFKEATKMQALKTADKEEQNLLLSQARNVLNQSTQLLGVAKKVVENPLESYHANTLPKIEKKINEDIATALDCISHKDVDISQVKERVLNSTKEIFSLCQDWQNLSQQKKEEVATKMAEHFTNMSKSISKALQHAPSDQTIKETTSAIQDLGKVITALVNSLSSEENEEGATAVATSCLSVISSLNAESKRNQALDTVSKGVKAVAEDLETAIMFTSAGIINSDEEYSLFPEHRERIVTKASLLVDNVKEIVTSVSSKDALIIAAKASLKTVRELGEEMKAGSASLGSDLQEAQVCLLGSAKVVASSLIDLIVDGKLVSQKEGGMDVFSNDAKNVVSAIVSLLKSVKTVEDVSSRGSQAIETALVAIDQELASLYSTELARPGGQAEDLVAASKAVTLAVSKAITVNCEDPDQVAAVANMGSKVVAEVLAACKASAAGSANSDKILAEGEMLAKQFQELLQHVLKKSSHPDGQEKTKMMEVSKGIAQTVTRIARLVENIKGRDWIDPKEQMEMIAENEMKKAAESIERAAQRLAELKLKRDVVVEEHDVENMTFDDLILDSAQSITKCTSALLQAATAAQQELVSQGKIAASSRQSSADSQWSQGLISAASMVATATQALCEAANSMIQEGTDGTQLVATARQVSKSTAQLVLACQVKADKDSHSMKGLKSASNAVRKATEELVKAAQATPKKTPYVRVKKDIFKERIEAEARVLQLEKEVGEARALEAELAAKTSFLVSDIRKAREAEGRSMTLAKELQAAREYVLLLNKKQYEGAEQSFTPTTPVEDPDLAVEEQVEREERGMRTSLRVLREAGNVRRNTLGKPWD